MVCRDVPGAPYSFLPYSLPPQPCFRPILPSAPSSLPPHAPFRPRLRSAPGSLPPQAPPTPLLALRACVGCQRIFTGRSQVWRRGACQLAYIDARCMRSCASAHRLICCQVAGWHVIALVHAFDSANSERPTAGARANTRSLGSFMHKPRSSIDDTNKKLASNTHKTLFIAIINMKT